MNHFAVEWLVDLPASLDLVLRVTVLLSVAWVVHHCLRACNPRWRVQLWRMTSLACCAIAAAMLMPKLAVSIVPSKHAKSSSRVMLNEPRFGAGEFASAADAREYQREGFFGLRSHAPSLAVTPVSQVTDAEPVQPTLVADMVPRLQPLLLAIWLTGAGLMAVKWTAAQWRLRRWLSRSVPAPESCWSILKRVGRGFECAGKVKLLMSDETDVPFVAGILRPAIVLPSRISEPEFQQELPAVFAHELTHVQSHDLVWMGILRWVSIPLWFHPLAWRMPSAHSMACEEVADAVAAGSMGDANRYSGILARIALSAVSHPPATAALSMARSPEIMSRLTRLQLGLSDTPLPLRRLGLFLLMAVLVVAPVAGLKLGFADADSSIRDGYGATDRVLEFPTDFSVGELSIATELEDEWWDLHAKRFDYRRDWNWQPFGMARGRVAIPTGTEVKLTLKADGAREMSWVKKLQTDAFHEISIFLHPANANIYPFGDEHARYLGHFSGLKKLELMGAQMTDRGIRHLESMTSLEVFLLQSPEISDVGLRSIGKMTSLEMLSLTRMKWTDAGLVHLANLKSLEEINLTHPGTPGRGFDTVMALPKLRYITAGTMFTDEHLARLGKAKILTALDLSQCEGVTDEGLKYLANVPNLEYLGLFKTNITDAGVKHLKPLKSLKRLDMNVKPFLADGREPALTPATAETLAELPSIEWLYFSNVGDPDEFLRHLSKLSNLKTLMICGTRHAGLISDAGLVHLSRLKQLERLSLSGTTITDSGLDSLAKLTKLEHLALVSDGITDEGLGRLSALKQLKYLSLLSSRKRGKLTPAGLSQLSGLSDLSELWYMIRPIRSDDDALDFSGLPNLEKFSMGGMRDKDFVTLANCKNLKWLQVGFDSHITDDGLSHLAGLTSMERLLVSGDGITDAGMVHLAGMDRLQSLTVIGNLTDEGLRHISRLNSLGALRIQTQSRVSQDEIEHLQASLPNLYAFTIDQDRTSIDTPETTLKVGQQAPPFEFKSLDGRRLSIDEYRGKVLLLYFWSTSCAPCVASMPKTKESYEQLSKYADFAMIGLSGDPSEPQLRDFVLKHKLPWPQTRIGTDSKLANAYGVTGYPTYILIGREGKILCIGTKDLDKRLRESLNIKDDA
ncbi:MAG: redoxin domain-containing protein [Planctomycetaceae bacterium]|nr:redoxin domain-containing protein [Planctomycetaceae bacterium]